MSHVDAIRIIIFIQKKFKAAFVLFYTMLRNVTAYVALLWTVFSILKQLYDFIKQWSKYILDLQPMYSLVINAFEHIY